MLDWDTHEQETLPLPEEEATPSTTRSRMAFYLVVGGILVVMGIIVGGVALWRYGEQQGTLEADLLRQIRAEESARLLGDVERTPDLIAPELPREWRTLYLSQFQPPDGEVQPVEITIERVEYSGVRAEVWVRVGAQLQRRAYEQTPQGWRRVPIIADDAHFGEVASLTEGGIEIRHYRSDEPFVITLAADLPALAAQIEVWDSAPERDGEMFIPPTITINPQEFRPPLLEYSDDSLILNSPQVVYIPPRWNISSESAMRFGVAEALWAQLPNQPVNNRDLPGASQMAIALKRVLALRWALPPAEYSTLTQTWQRQAQSSLWVSPFLPINRDGNRIEPFAPQTDALPFLLIADRLIDEVGSDAGSLSLLRATLANSATWDEFLGIVVGDSALVLEAELRGIPLPPEIGMPFVATFPTRQKERGNPPNFFVEVAGQPTPIILDGLGGGSELQLPDGTTLPFECASLFGELEIAGTWRETGLRLAPTMIRVPRLTLPATFASEAPPMGTVAYVAVYTETTGSAIQGITRISALTPDGNLTPVLTPNQSTIVPFGGVDWGTSNSTTGIMFVIPGEPGCEAQWYLRYVPGEGITGAWFAPQVQRSATSTFLNPRWNDQSGRGLMVEVTTWESPIEVEQMPFWWLDGGEPSLLGEPDGYLPAGSAYQLSPDGSSVIVYQPTPRNSIGSAFAWVELATGEVQATFNAPAIEYGMADFAYSADGDSFYVVWRLPAVTRTVTSATLLQEIDLRTGVATDWLSQEAGQIFFIAPDSQSPHLYAMTLSLEAQNDEGVRLVKLTAEGSSVLNNGGEAFGITTVLRCATGGFLYLRLDTPTEQETRYELDPRYLHRVTIDETGEEINLRLPLSATQIPLLCP